MRSHSTTERKPNGAPLSRGDKARRIVEAGGVQRHPRGHGHHWLVDSESGSGQYRVHQYTVEGRDRYGCTCPDYTKHAEGGDLGWACKHIQAVWFAEAQARTVAA